MTGLLVMLIAVSAQAQFPMGGGMGGGRPGGMGGMGGMGGGPRGMDRGGMRAQSMKFPTAKLLEKYNPADLMLDKHKKLKLTDAQQESFKTLRSQIFERNAPLMARYDSLQRTFTPPTFEPRSSGEPSPTADSTRRAAVQQMMQLRLLVDSLQDRRRADVQQVLGALTDDAQRTKAVDYLDKQDIEFSKEFPRPAMLRGEPGMGGEDGPRGERGGRRPPA